MKYLKRFNESKEHYYVVIEWEHGDADGHSLERYPFKTEDDMDEFLHFIYELRKYNPTGGYKNSGNFQDDHYTREGKWIDEVDKKYGGKYSKLIPNDNRFRHGGRYSPAVEHIWVEVDGQILSIIWERAIRNKIIDLPKIGDEIEISTGHISFYGPTLWGGKNDDYYGYEDFAHRDDDFPKDEYGHSTQYSKVKVKVTDCKIQHFEPYKRENWDYDTDKIKYSYLTYNDITRFNYVLLCRFGDYYLTCSLDDMEVGFDPNYDKKYHYPKYGTNYYYLVI